MTDTQNRAKAKIVVAGYPSLDVMEGLEGNMPDTENTEDHLECIARDMEGVTYGDFFSLVVPTREEVKLNPENYCYQWVDEKNGKFVLAFWNPEKQIYEGKKKDIPK